MKLGEKIRKLRKEKGYTLQQIANKAFLSRQGLSQIEQNTIVNCMASTKEAIAKALGVTVYYFSDDEKERQLDIMCRNFLSLNEDNQKAIETMVEILKHKIDMSALVKLITKK